MSAPRGFFVTGTDTGVGKTLVACALVRGLRTRGVDAGAMKPVETGVGEVGPLDALALRRAAGDEDPLEDVCPLRYALAAAPTVAASADGRDVEVWAIRQAYERLAVRHDCVIVEGAGGLLVPVAEQFSMADLARELELPLLVVARAALGTINHTLLTLEVAVARGLSVVGVVISHAGACSREPTRRTCRPCATPSAQRSWVRSHRFRRVGSRRRTRSTSTCFSSGVDAGLGVHPPVVLKHPRRASDPELG